MVCLFGAIVHLLDIPLIIEKVRTPFPDCIARRTDTNEEVRIEFELYSSHFKKHRHDINQCDLLVCWQDDLGKWPNGFVLELHDLVKERCAWLIEEIRQKPLGVPWCEETFFQRCEENRLADEQLNEINIIMDFAKREGLGPEWLDTPSGTFAVGDYKRFFKIHADGQIAFPFLRLDAGDLFPELFDRLNTALEEQRFLPGAERKKKAREGIRPQELGSLFQSRKQLDAFLDVWKWFVSVRQRLRG
ncbi:MAG: hypothetical protein DWQ31_04915 [Planctomycetota bacterium]|nr:MAG: hypothetical protein DWQ31_04915 [Planctomycetota bacterium]REK21966.1 MAG: hypothetical protein DWQ42_18395 [Planctomycetota bacterium]